MFRSGHESAGSCDGFSCNSTLILSHLSFAGFPVPITEPFDEDVEEVDDDEVEELVDRPGTTKGT